MAEDISKPSQNPASSSAGMGAALAEILKKYQQTLDGMLPASVVQYDRDQNIATIQPMIMFKSTNGEQLQRAPVAEIPCLAFGGGGFFINFPLKKGDLGWILAADRDISLFIQDLANSAPNTARLSTFSDGLFIPDVFRNYAIDEEDKDNMVMSSVDSSMRIAIGSGKVKVTAPAVVLDSPKTTITGDLQVDGDALLNAKFDVKGAATATAGLTIDGIPFGTHRHMEQGDGQPTGTPIT